MVFHNPTVPTLQQMSFVLIAVKICTELEVMALMKRYGHASFLIPSKEIYTFLNKKILEYIPPRKTYGLIIKESKFCFLENDSISMYFSGNSCSPDPQLNEYRFTENNLPCVMWEELISRKISCLALPNSLKSVLMSLMRCICIEIYQWQKDHKDIFRFQLIDFQRYFCWNSEGKIDKVKTAKSLIDDESLCITDRYNLARLYFFVSDVICLWKELPPLFKDEVRDSDDQKVWFQYIEKRTDVNLNRICRTSLYNPFNLRAYFSLLTQNEKAEWFKFYLHRKSINYEDLCVCLSLLEKTEQELILKQYSSKILQYYLVWPLQNEFLDVLKNIWPYMSIENYTNILYFIIYERIMIGWKDCDYVDLLKELWRQTPNNFKELVKNYEIYRILLLILSYELENSFPNKAILENYKGRALKFHHIGRNYCIAKMTYQYGRYYFENCII
ncbi:uncharacterized protein TNCT_116671 [Trichonephila clavata]|uniref:Uncharacterized protein n=1 Tax=Trichonephila clavata TaxID=2740835 RepID=A0A8X6K8N2_TRICU|nr:uncharacterized protein TNCT_116671 [Trichonephila clavata]